MDKTNLQKKLICVEYPGIVKNIDYMVQSLGGYHRLSHIFSNEKLRLPLKFRPNNVYAKPTLGDVKQSTGILFKVKIRKRKHTNAAPEIIETAIIGSVNRVYKFTAMCDYQFVPLDQNKQTKEIEFIYDKCVPNGFTGPDWLTSSSDETSYFLPPIYFSRVETGYPLFKKETPKLHGSTVATDSDAAGLIGNRRLRRHKHTKYQSFNLNDEFPIESHSMTADFLKLKFITQMEYDKVKQLFDKRPILSRMVVAYETKISNEKLRYILPTLGFYFTTGPWRIMWCRFGYDPRKHFESRYYQHLDFRIALHLREFVDLKRSYRTIAKLPEQKQPKTPIDSPNQQKKDEIFYFPYFEDGKLPPSRQCIYQYCDVRIPQIQEMLDKLPTPRSGAICNEKTGWLPASFDEQCREIMLQTFKNIVINRMEAVNTMDADNDDDDDAEEYANFMQEDGESSDDDMDTTANLLNE